MKAIWGKLSQTYKANFKILVGLIFVILILLAWQDRFMLDDAFISLRYADNLVNGDGLVWNPGERIEGYTNFMWTLILALPLVFSIDPVQFIYLLGMGMFALCLVYIYKLGVLILDSPHLALFAVLLIGINSSFRAFSTGGLETMFQTLLFVAASYQILRCIRQGAWPASQLLILGFLYAAMLLTRLDSALFVIVFFPIAFWGIWRGFINALKRENAKPALHFGKLAALSLPPLLMVGGWFAWKYAYYGGVLPNSLHARPVGDSWPRGLYYVGTFLWAYGLFILFPLVVVACIAWWRRASRQIDWKLAPMAGFVFLWWAYLVYMGGDWMAFRLLVPVMPFVFIMGVGLIWRHLNIVCWQVILSLALLLCAFFPLPFEAASGVFPTVSSVAEHFEGLRMTEIGLQLKQMLGQESNVSIAVVDAGTIPFYSRLPAVDMLGINDPWVLENGVLLTPNPPFGSLPGHVRIAPVEYLREKNVNLIISRPWWESKPDGGSRLYTWKELIFLWPVFPILFEGDPDPQPGDALLVIPIADDLYLRAIYLTPHPAIDAAIENYAWQVIPIIN